MMAETEEKTSPGNQGKWFSWFRSKGNNGDATSPQGAKSDADYHQKGRPSEVSEHISKVAKEGKRPLSAVIRSVPISSPYKTERHYNAKFDADSLSYTGIPEEWVSEAHKQFGVPLSSVPKMEVPGYDQRIPIILVKLRGRLEELGGFETEGIFRLAPNGAESTDVKASINAGQALDSLKTTEDPHIVSNLIKQFFRDLPPNLLNVLNRDQIIQMAEMKDNDQIKEATNSVPEPQRSTLFWLLDLMIDIATFENKNKMSARNLAIVISPNLFTADKNVAPMEALVLSQKVAQLIVTLIKWRIAFNEARDAESATKTKSKTVEQSQIEEAEQQTIAEQEERTKNPEIPEIQQEKQEEVSESKEIENSKPVEDKGEVDIDPKPEVTEEQVEETKEVEE